MEINEVKVGDMVTYKNKQGKQVKGKVIHRHDGKDASHLTGHVNIQKIGGVPSFPVTVHVSDIKPHITEETDMQNENVYTMIDSIQTGDTDRTETLFREIMNTKIADVLASNKEEVAKSMFNTNECADCEAEEVDEALKGNQHKIDANKNGKVDAHDFKLLRKKKGVKEEAEQVDELSIATYRDAAASRDKQATKAANNDDYKTADALEAKKKKLSVYASKKEYSKSLSPATKRVTGMKEEAEYVDEGNAENKKKKTVTNLDVVSRQLGKPLIVKGMPPQHILDRLKRKNSNLTDAYSDPYAAKKSAEMKKAHAATMADAKKEYDAARKPKFAKNFMKMNKEDVELEEGNAENKMKKNAYADAKGAANKNLDRGSQRRVDSRRTDEVDSIKKGIDNYAPKKAPVRNIIRGKVFGKMSDTETKMFARKRVKEDVNLQELDADTLRSYISKRAKPGQLDAARKGDSTAKKKVKGISNANASLTKKYKSKLDVAYNNAAAASYNKAKPGTYHGD